MAKPVHWIVTVDDRSAVLYSGVRMKSGELQLERVRVLKNEHEGEHEFHRPVLLGGGERRGSLSRSSAGAAPHSSSPGHEVEEEHRRFARELLLWLGQIPVKSGIDPVNIYAPPLLVGFLRHEMARIHDADSRFAIHESELSKLTTSELAQHQAVRAVIQQPASTG